MALNFITKLRTDYIDPIVEMFGELAKYTNILGPDVDMLINN